MAAWVAYRRVSPTPGRGSGGGTGKEVVDCAGGASRGAARLALASPLLPPASPPSQQQGGGVGAGGAAAGGVCVGGFAEQALDGPHAHARATAARWEARASWTRQTPKMRARDAA